MGRGIWGGMIPTLGDTDVALEVDRLLREWETGSTFEIPIRLSTGIPICYRDRLRSPQLPRNRGTHPPSVVNQLLSVDFVQSRQPDVVSFHIGESTPKLFVLPP